jgi:hypothetical protein
MPCSLVERYPRLRGNCWQCVAGSNVLICTYSYLHRHVHEQFSCTLHMEWVRCLRYAIGTAPGQATRPHISLLTAEGTQKDTAVAIFVRDFNNERKRKMANDDA